MNANLTGENIVTGITHHWRIRGMVTYRGNNAQDIPVVFNIDLPSPEIGNFDITELCDWCACKYDAYCGAFWNPKRLHNTFNKTSGIVFTDSIKLFNEWRSNWDGWELYFSSPLSSIENASTIKLLHSL